MRKSLAVFAAVSILGLAVAGCGGAQRATANAKLSQKARQKTAALPLDLYLKSDEEAIDSGNELRIVGMDDGPVPSFRLRAVDGKVLNSDGLIGEKPFVVLFFATWCQMCAQKMPLMKSALEALGPLTVIGVSVDDPETFAHVPAFMHEYGFKFPLVRGAEHPRFSLAYNPFSLVPLVVVVGRNGGLVDYQMGYAPNDGERLIAAVELARVIAPLRPHGQGQGQPRPDSGHPESTEPKSN